MKKYIVSALLASLLMYLCIGILSVTSGNEKSVFDAFNLKEVFSSILFVASWGYGRWGYLVLGAIFIVLTLTIELGLRKMKLI